MNSDDAERDKDRPAMRENDRPSTLKLWSGLGVPVLAWGLHLFLSYGLVEWYCENVGYLEVSTVKWLLHALTVAALVLGLWGVWLNWRNRQQLKRGTKGGRAMFMVNGGLILGPFLMVVIVVQGLPNLVLMPCV